MGENLFSISGLPLDLSDIQQVQVSFSLAMADVLRVTDVSAVPEPETALLLGGGLVLLAAQRRRAAA